MFDDSIMSMSDYFMRTYRFFYWHVKLNELKYTEVEFYNIEGARQFMRVFREEDNPSGYWRKLLSMTKQHEMFIYSMSDDEVEHEIAKMLDKGYIKVCLETVNHSPFGGDYDPDDTGEITCYDPTTYKKISDDRAIRKPENRTQEKPASQKENKPKADSSKSSESSKPQVQENTATTSNAPGTILTGQPAPAKETSEISPQKMQLLNEAREAQLRAIEARNLLPPYLRKKKVVASNGDLTISGWGTAQKIPNKFNRDRDIDDLIDNVQGNNHNLYVNSGLDNGRPGSYAASHAEKQLQIIHENNPDLANKPIGVSKEMCGDCREWFREEAIKTNNSIVVGDPKCIRVFNSDGSVEIYGNNDSLKLLEVVEVNTKSLAGVTSKYEGLAW